MPGPRRARKAAIGESSRVGSSSSMRVPPQGIIATRTPSCSTSSTCSTASPSASQKPRASSIERTAMPTWSTPSIMGSAAIAQELPRDDQPLHLAGALADGADLGVAVELLGAVVLDETVAAVDLYAALAAEDRGFAGGELGLGGDQRHRAAGVHRLGGGEG